MLDIRVPVDRGLALVYDAAHLGYSLPAVWSRHTGTPTEKSRDMGKLKLNGPTLVQQLERLRSTESIEALRAQVATLRGGLCASEPDLVAADATDYFEIDPHVLFDELDQIAASRTIKRAHYYVERLIKAITEVRTSAVNDINLNRWKEYDHVITDSLWLVERRDSTGVHRADYWGNFIPQIPHQMMLRYTKQDEWILDPFAGLGTSLIEAQRLGRNALGVELQPDVAGEAQRLIAEEPNPHGVVCQIISGDSCRLDFSQILARHGRGSVQLAILHPPYFDIIRFSEDERDLSNAASVSEFLEQLIKVVDGVRAVLDPGRYLVLVIGDKYNKGEWIPLGFLAMNNIMERGFLLKSIIVKNFQDTAGKRGQKELWRYRALAGGFYVFKHEYIFVFQMAH
jgi:SAM-dependent methyltransferase